MGGVNSLEDLPGAAVKLRIVYKLASVIVLQIGVSCTE